MTDRDLATVGKTGFGRRGGLTIHDRDVVAQLRKVISRADAQQAAAQNDDFHEGSLNGSRAGRRS
jgi:hypothetical protein